MSASSSAFASFEVVAPWASSSVGCDISNAVRGSKVVVGRCGGSALSLVSDWAWSPLRRSRFQDSLDRGSRTLTLSSPFIIISSSSSRRRRRRRSSSISRLYGVALS